MNIKKQLEAVFYFLNNTDGEIKEYQLNYLFELTKHADKEITEEDIEYLSSLIESGDRNNNVDLFVKYIIDGGF